MMKITDIKQMFEENNSCEVNEEKYKNLQKKQIITISDLKNLFENKSKDGNSQNNFLRFLSSH